MPIEASLSGQALQEALQEALKGAGCGTDSFDEATTAYMASTIDDAEEVPAIAEELWELLGDLFQDAGVEEAKGLEVCRSLVARLSPASAEEAPPTAKRVVKPEAGTACAGAGGYPAKGTVSFTRGVTLEKPVVPSEFLATGSNVGGGLAPGGLGEKPKGGLEKMPQESLKVVAAVSKAKREKAARRAKRRVWRAEEKTEDDGVWVDLPPGQSIGMGGSTVADIHIDKFSLPNKRGSGDLLRDVTVTFAQGRRYGLIGQNGIGKSTLLDSIARREVPGIPETSIFYVRQEIEGDPRTPVEWILQADSERQTLLAEKARLETSDGAAAEKDAGVRLTQIYQRLEELGSDTAHAQEARAHDILLGLGFTKALREKPTQELSGGWRMRTALACALFVSPGLLLLDEPTNHLDLETVLWLERYLNEEFHQTLLVVSHDRIFLNEVVTDIVLFENEGLEVYRGDYWCFEKVRAEHRLRQERLRETQEAKREHLQEFITKHAEAGNNGCKAAAQRKARIRKLERLGMEAQAQIDGRKLKVSYDGAQDDISEVEEARKVVLNFPDPGVCDSLGNALFRFADVEFGYEGCEPLFSGVSLSVEQASRVALLGRNGAGKSTLIKLLLGRLKPRAGACAPHRGARVEYIAQHHLDELDGESRPLRVTLERFPGDGSNSHELRVRQHLGAFGISGDVLPNQQIKTMSGGQKFRLSLALAMYRKPHLVVMDEPTNHLDLETIDALVQAAETFQGGIVIVSHDEHLIGSLCKELYVMANKRVTRFKGSIAEYKAQVLKSKK